MKNGHFNFNFYSSNCQEPPRIKSCQVASVRLFSFPLIFPLPFFKNRPKMLPLEKSNISFQSGLPVLQTVKGAWNQTKPLSVFIFNKNKPEHLRLMASSYSIRDTLDVHVLTPSSRLAGAVLEPVRSCTRNSVQSLYFSLMAAETKAQSRVLRHK